MNATDIARYTYEWNGLITTIRPIVTFFVMAGFVSNTFVLVLFWRLEKLKTWDNAFNINMTVSNLISSVASLVLPFTPELPSARMASCHSLRIMQTCNIVKFLSLVEIALLRYWRVYKPSNRISKLKFQTGLVIPWAVAILVLIMSLIVAPNDSVKSCVEAAMLLGHVNILSRSIVVLLSFTVGSVVMTICYVKIMIHYKHRCFNHVHNMTAVQQGTSVTHISGRQFVHRMRHFYQGQKEEDTKVVVSSVLVVAAFYIINMPNMLLYCFYNGGIIKHISPTLDYILLFHTVGFAMNPVIYSMRSKYFRKGFKQLLHGRPNSVSMEMDVPVSMNIWDEHK